MPPMKKNRPWVPAIIVSANTLGRSMSPMILDLSVAGAKIFTDIDGEAYSINPSHTFNANWTQRHNLSAGLRSDKVSVDSWMTSGNRGYFDELNALAAEQEGQMPPISAAFNEIKRVLSLFKRSCKGWDKPIPVYSISPSELWAVRLLPSRSSNPLWPQDQEMTVKLWAGSLQEFEGIDLRVCNGSIRASARIGRVAEILHQYQLMRSFREDS